MTHLLLIALLAITPFFAAGPAEAPIVSAPNELIYENMAPGEQRTKFVQVTNRSNKELKVLPQLVVTTPMISVIDVAIKPCDDLQALEPCSSSAPILELTSGETKRLSVTVTIDRNLTQAFPNSLGASELVFLSEEFVTPRDTNTISQEEKNARAQEKLPRTGSDLAAIVGLASLFTLSGAILSFIVHRRRIKPQTFNTSK